MIEGLIAAALRFRAAVIGGTLLLVAVGTWALATIHLDAFPELSPNQVDVLTDAPGLSPVEVENLVSYRIETALRGLPGTQGVRSISKAGISIVTVVFDDDVDLFFARGQVQQRMQEASDSLPEGLHPTLAPASTVAGEIFQYLVESDSASLMDLHDVQEYTIEPQLLAIPGIADVNSWGGMVRQFHVDVDPNRLAGYGLTLDDVSTALADNNSNFGAGYIENRGERFTIRGVGRLASEADIAGILLATRTAGAPVAIRDVASVAVGPMPREGAVSRDGRGEALAGKIFMLKGANGREVVKRVEERMEVVKTLLPPGITIRPYYNQGDVVDQTTRTVFTNLAEGGLLVALILFLFLRNWRAALVVASVIPLSLLAAAIAMREAGVSANLMSLGALDFGLLVDASIVMVENFVRRLERAGTSVGSERLALFREAAFEVGRPILFGVAIIVAVYVPIFSLQGLEGRMFTPMALTVCVSVLGSLVLALTYVPALSSFVLQHAAEKPARWFEWLTARYRGVLGWALGHRITVVGGAAAVLVGALASVPFLGTEFMPELDEGSLLIETRRFPSVSLPQGQAIAAEVERTLMELPEVQTVVTNLGRPQLATEAMGLYDGDVYINFHPDRKPRSDEIEALIERMDEALQHVPGLAYAFSAPMAMRLEEAISGVRTDLGIKVVGDDLASLERLSEEIAEVVESIPGADDVSVGVSSGTMQLEIVIDRPALARYGLNVADVRRAVETGIGGREATEVIDGRRRFPVVVRMGEPYRNTPETIGQLLLTSTSGARVPLSQVAKIEIVEGPERILHEDGRRTILVQSNVRGRDLGSFVADVQREIRKQVAMPQGYFVTYSGQFENQQRAMARLAVIVPSVLLLIIGFLYAAFGNGPQAVLVMCNVPFALVGGIAALWLRDLNLSLSAAVGFIALFGVAVLNGVVLIAHINQLRQTGRPLDEAVRTGAEVRLRPVLMTAIVASVGFLPMALSTSQGAEVQRPLATVVIGGLVTSTMLTLLVLPVLYEWLEARRLRRTGLWSQQLESGS